jgi:16S rRNA (adenine1518-N6/adenine1519-N6)-dimethyltransferase
MDSELSALERVVRAAFGKRRKTISNSLRGGGFPPARVAAALAEARIDPRDRSEKVEPERLLDLARALTRKE